ncbi:B-box domain protein 30-like protein [Drosera capensis]
MKNQLGRDGRSCCELCEKEARMYCESDKARLCLDCDRKVHAANFLVAKHCRTLLCHLCRSLTPWKAAGPNLGSIVSLCHDCVSIKSNCTPRVPIKAVDDDEKKTEPVREEDEDDDDDDDDDDNEDLDEESCGEIDEEEDEEEEEDDDENQVVPWTRTPPPPASGASGSSSGEEESGFGGRLKRAREVGTRQHHDDDDDDSEPMSPRRRHRRMDSVGDESTTPFRFMGISKHRRITLQA